MFYFQQLLYTQIAAGAPKCSSVNTYTIAVEISYFTDFINSNINDGTFCYS